MKRTLVIGLTSAALAACGGGSGSGSNSETDSGANAASGSVQVGYLDTVAGLSYRTATLSGVTSERGAFEYREGEDITFALGTTDLVTVTPETNLSLFELLDSAFTLPRTAKEIRAQLRAPESYEVQSQLANIVDSNHPSQVSGLHQASNIMQLLLALDSDRDASNGIDLTQTEWQPTLDELDVTFEMRLSDFYKVEPMLTFQQETGISLAMDKTVPLTTLYQLGGVNVSATVRARDISFTSSVAYSTDYVLNESGQVTAKTKIDTKREEIALEYDANGNLTQETSRTDQDRNGSYDSSHVLTRTWNVFSMPTTTEYSYYTGDLETLNNINFTQYTYRDNRTRLTERAYLTDNNGDGTPDNFQNATYQADEKNRLISISSEKVDADGNPIRTISIETQSYDEAGRTGRYIYRGGFDMNGQNPTSNSAFTFSYEGNSTSQTIIEDGLTSVYTETYNNDGLIILKEATLFNAEEQLIYQSNAPYSYDEQGRLTGCEVSVREQPTTPVIVTKRVSYSYDENGVSTITSQQLADQQVTRENTVTFEYGEDGERLKFTQAADRYTDYHYSDDSLEDALGHVINDYLLSQMPISRMGYCYVDAGRHR
ncbi:hypothetical protein [Litoribacillus peritrichatus]|uniref:YD repeat-containing protein n=1 Tax=Litoribacillus peritrichatus TaxID=718191 RepID=A0ABP7M9V7_9GAMM